MKNFHYYKKKEDHTTITSIQIQFSYKHKKFKLGTGISLEDKFWDKNCERIVDCEETKASGLFHLNDNLNRIELECMKHFRLMQSQGRLSAYRFQFDVLKSAFKRIVKFKPAHDSNKVKERDQKRIRDLESSYIRARLKRSGFNIDQINTRPDLIALKREIIKIKRLITQKNKKNVEK
jgi:hypothetical protein